MTRSTKCSYCGVDAIKVVKLLLKESVDLNITDDGLIQLIKFSYCNHSMNVVTNNLARVSTGVDGVFT